MGYQLPGTVLTLPALTFRDGELRLTGAVGLDQSHTAGGRCVSFEGYQLHPSGTLGTASFT